MSLHLADKDAGGIGGCLRTTGTHNAIDNPGDKIDQALHQPKVIGKGGEGGDKNKRGNQLESEYKRARLTKGRRHGLAVGQGPQYKYGPRIGKAQYLFNRTTQKLEESLPPGCAKNKHGKNHLQAQPTDNQTPIHGSQVIRHLQCDRKYNEDTDEARKLCHCPNPLLPQRYSTVLAKSRIPGAAGIILTGMAMIYNIVVILTDWAGLFQNNSVGVSSCPI